MNKFLLLLFIGKYDQYELSIRMGYLIQKCIVVIYHSEKWILNTTELLRLYGSQESKKGPNNRDVSAGVTAATQILRTTSKNLYNQRRRIVQKDAGGGGQ